MSAVNAAQGFVNRVFKRDLDSTAWFVDVPGLDFADEVEADLLDNCIVFWNRADRN